MIPIEYDPVASKGPMAIGVTESSETTTKPPSIWAVARLEESSLLAIRELEVVRKESDEASASEWTPAFNRILGHATKATRLLEWLADQLKTYHDVVIDLSNALHEVSGARYEAEEIHSQLARIREHAQDQADQIVSLAKAEARQVIANAESEAKKISEATNKARKDMASAKADLKSRIANIREMEDKLDKHIARKLKVAKRIEAECVRLEATATMMASLMATESY